MNILVSTPSVVEFCNGKYYNNSMSAVIPRYKRMSEHLTCLNIIKPCEKSQQNLLNWENVRFINVYKINSLKGLFFKQKKNAKIVETAVEQADLCIAHLPSFVAEQVVKYAKKHKKPCLQVVGGCAWDAHWNYGIRGKLIAPFRFWVTRKTISKANHVIYVTKEFLQKRYPTQGRSIGCSDVILPTNSLEVLKNRLKRIHSLRSAKRPLVLVTLAPVDVKYKGQEYVVRAMAKLLKDGVRCEYHLIGGGNPSYLKNISDHLGITKQMKFYGSVPHDDIASVLDGADIYIQPSKTEGLPRALVEAMSRACPALGSNVAGIPELLDEKCIFRSGNVNDIYKLLAAFNPDKMEQCAKRNYEEAQKYNFLALENYRNKFLDEFLKDGIVHS